jgi:5-methylcytosine-specific restriction endonuclease McrA
MPTQNKVDRPWIKKSLTQSEKKTDPFYYSTPWRKLRDFVISLDPRCYYCLLANRTTLAVIGDHLRPRKLFPELQLIHTNIKPCCDECHNKKRRFEKDITTRESFEALLPTFIKKISV